MQCLVKDVVQFLNEVPKTIAAKTEIVSKSIADKIHMYADKMSGVAEEADGEDDGEKDTTIYVNKKHQIYLDALRRTHADVYTTLLAFSQTIMKSNSSREQTVASITAFIEKNIKDLKLSK
jgi:hypothetical protein